jgi:predicted DNA-binding protein
MKTDKTGGRRNTAIPISLPPDEALRLRRFAQAVGRPMSWVMRDALRLYLDALEGDARALAARTNPGALDVGTVPPPDMPRAGRPKGSRNRSSESPMSD